MKRIFNQLINDLQPTPALAKASLHGEIVEAKPAPRSLNSHMRVWSQSKHSLASYLTIAN
jgi:hypothetical protein